jgi:PKD repeat protein
VADSQALGTIGTYDSKDFIDAPGWEGFAVGGAPVVPPVAAFTADVVSGTAPLTVHFSDESTGNPTAWAWDFDNDGAADSTAQNPTYTYDAAGIYTVKLTVTNLVGTDSEVKTDYITVTAPPAPVAAFTADLTTGSAPLTVQFSDESTGNPTAWAWDFDNDGAVDSTAQNPTHTYDTAGTYAVKLTVTNIVGSDDEVKTDYVTVTTPPLPIAAFSADLTTGSAPLTVQFSDESTGNPTAWAWDFDNDGAVDSTAQNPTHTYDTGGTYTVKLTVTNVVGSDDEVKTDYVTVTTPPLPVAAFSADLTSGTAPLTVYFTDQSAGNPTAWAWDFDGDGDVDSTEQSPSHVYDTAGTYTVKLTVVNTAGSDDELRTDYISVAAPPVPVAAFRAEVVSGPAPLTVHFTDTSAGNPTAWIWDFNNDGTADSTTRNPTYTYDTAGMYTVKLTVTNLAGSDSEVKTDYITVTLAALWGPYVTGTTTTSAVVSVKTNVASAVTVDYATEAEYTASGTYNLSAADGTDAQLHHIELTGLDPDTAYHYRVVFGAESTADCHFSTFPTSGQFNFVVVSDAQDQLPLFSQSERFKLVADSIAAQPDVAFVLITGDLVNDGSNLANWDRFFDASREMLANTTLYTALGNHEENDALYYEIFGLPAYYSFDCGDAHFAVLDSNMAISAQTTWLESDLDDSKAWKFVAFHHPLYTSDPNHFGGWANLRAEWEGLFQTYGVDAVWNGHFHAYERYLHDGVHYMVIGTGGGPLYKLGDERYDGYQSSLVNSLAYAKVTVDPTTGACIMDIIQVADVSANNAEVTTMYPPDSVFESVLLTQGWPNWDMNGDHVCNIADVVIMGLRWGETGDPGWIPEDVNQDGVVDMLDVAIMELHWRDTWDDT